MAIWPRPWLSFGQVEVGVAHADCHLARALARLRLGLTYAGCYSAQALARFRVGLHRPRMRSWPEGLGLWGGLIWFSMPGSHLA